MNYHEIPKSDMPDCCLSCEYITVKMLCGLSLVKDSKPEDWLEVSDNGICDNYKRGEEYV